MKELKPEELLALRNKIDALDTSILESLAERQQVVRKVIQSKIATSTQIRDLEREDKLLERIREKAVLAGLDPYFAEQLFRDIIFQSVRYQNHSLVDHQNEAYEQTYIRVAFQGIEGSYSHLAALRHFQERYTEVDCLGFASLDELVVAVESDKVDVAILPLENTSAGSINDSYDRIGESKLFLVGEEIFKVNHVMVALEPIEHSKIRRIISHPITLVQCSNFLNQFKHTTIESYADSAMGALKVKTDKDLSQVAICSQEAAQLYGLEVLEQNVSNRDENFTRYVLVSKKQVHVDAQLPAKTSLILSTVHEKGALINCLQVFDQHGINMTKLESRPRTDKSFQYQFYIDIEANVDNPKVKTALKEIENKAASFRILGCYPKQSD